MALCELFAWLEKEVSLSAGNLFRKTFLCFSTLLIEWWIHNENIIICHLYRFPKVRSQRYQQQIKQKNYAGESNMLHLTCKKNQTVSFSMHIDLNIFLYNFINQSSIIILMPSLPVRSKSCITCCFSLVWDCGATIWWSVELQTLKQQENLFSIEFFFFFVCLVNRKTLLGWVFRPSLVSVQMGP